MLKQHKIKPDYMNLIQIHYHTTIKGKVKGILEKC